MHCSVNENENPNGKLYDGTCVQDTRDPSVPPCNRISSVVVRMSVRIQMDEENLNLRARTIWAEAVISV